MYYGISTQFTGFPVLVNAENELFRKYRIQIEKVCVACPQRVSHQLEILL